MVYAISASWASVEPFMRGLKFGGLMNQALEKDETFRQGRHHFMTAINQILEGSLVLEHMSACFQAANVEYSLKNWNIASIVVPIGAAYLSSRQIRVLHISEAANFVQNHLGHLSFIAMVVSSVALLILGKTLLAATTLVYVTIGLLDRHNVLPESAQTALRQANFFIGNVAGLYFGGAWIRLICSVNLITPTVQRYFEYKRLATEKVLHTEQVDTSDCEEFAEDIETETDVTKNQVSSDELQELTSYSLCTVCKEHVQKKPLPTVDAKVQVADILDLVEQIDWSLHEHVIQAKLAKDKRWLEIGQFESDPLDYFKRNLCHLVESIRDRQILQGKPLNYDMLEFYCRYIAQELQILMEKNEEEVDANKKKQNELTIIDTLVWMGIEGGEYCGTGKFGIVEEIYESLITQAEGLPLETRVLACLQQERQHVWQRIYQLMWKTNPMAQFIGYLSDVNAIHNANIFSNMMQAGKKFGIPHQAAKNDSAAEINPFIQHIAMMQINIVVVIEDCFWQGAVIPQAFIAIDTSPGARKWIQFNNNLVYVKPYDAEAILTRFKETIGSPQIPKFDIYTWWQNWIYRQNDLTEDEQEALSGDLQAVPQEDEEGNWILTFNGEPFEINGEIQPKFLKVMLIEMGIFNKPLGLAQA